MINIQPLAYENKTETLRRQLKSLAEQLGANQKLPTVRELTKAYNVSVVTLDRAMRQLEADGILIRKHGVGIFATETVAFKTIGLVYDHNIFDNLESPFPRILVEALHQCAQERDKQFILYLDTPSYISGIHGYEEFLKDLAGHKLDGVLCCSKSRPGQIEQLEQHKTPYVIMGVSHYATAYNVNFDLDSMVRQGIDALVEHGCNHIAMLTNYGSTRLHWPDFLIDLKAFESTIESHGEKISSHLLWEPQVDFKSDSILETIGYQTIIKIAKNNILPCNGLLVTNDMMTRGVLQALDELGIRVGHDIQLATQANRSSPVLKLAPTNIILLENDPRQLAKEMFGLLNSIISGNEHNPREIMLKPTLRILT